MARTVLNPHFVASQGGYSRDRAAGVYQRMKSQAAVTTNDWEMARYVLVLGGTPILRIRCPDDDDADARFDPIEYVDTAHTELSVAEHGIAGAALKGRIHIGNELGSATPKRTAAWLEKAIRRATFHKRKAVAANWSVKNPRPFMHEYLKGVYVAIKENGGEMGAHEGAYIDPQTKEVFRTFEECLAGGCIGGWRDAAQQYGFRVRITEFAASKTPVDGWSTWMSEAEFAALCDDAGAFYAESGIEAHIYTAFRWDRGTGFEYVDVPTLQDEFAKTNAAYEVKEVNMPTTTPPPAGLSGAFAAETTQTGLRLRAAPSTNAAIIRTLPLAEQVTVYSTPLTAFEQYDFAYLKDSLGNTGYAAISINGVQQFAPPVPNPPVEPEPSVKGRYLSPEAETALREELDNLHEATNKIMNLLDAAPEVAPPDPAIPF